MLIKQNNTFNWVNGLAILIAILCVNSAQSQNTDSIKVSKNDSGVIIGTCVLRGSEKNMSSAMSYGLGLTALKASQCMSSGEHLPPTQINKIYFVKDSLVVIEIQTSANCSHHFLGEIEVVEDSIINLTSTRYGGYAFCSCCFGLTYTIAIMKFQNFNPDKVKYVMIEGWKETLKTISWNKN